MVSGPLKPVQEMVLLTNLETVQFILIVVEEITKYDVFILRQVLHFMWINLIYVHTTRTVLGRPLVWQSNCFILLIDSMKKSETGSGFDKSNIPLVYWTHAVE